MLLRIWEIVVLKKGLKYECFLRCRRQQQCKDFLASKRREMNEKVKIPPPSVSPWTPLYPAPYLPSPNAEKRVQQLPR